MENISEKFLGCRGECLENLALRESKAFDDLGRIMDFLEGDEASRMDLHEAERGLLRRLLRLGKTLLELFLAKEGNGKSGNTVSTGDDSLPYHQDKTTTYLSIFGSVEIKRAYYWKRREQGRAPLDEKLNLPERRYSYLLQEFGELLGVDGSFGKVTDVLETLLRVRFWSQGVQCVARDTAKSVQPFYQNGRPLDPASEGEILVAAVDGKGVRLRRAPEQREPKPPFGKKVERPRNRKESIVSAVYTLDRSSRTVDEVMDSITGEGSDREKSNRPKPRNKRLRATLAGKEKAFAETRRHMWERDPDGKKEWVVLTDGDNTLQSLAHEYLTGPNGMILILDIMHPLSYLWEAANALHGAGSRAATEWVYQKLRLLLEGKVGYVVGTLRRQLTTSILSRAKTRALKKAIRYLDNNRAYMAYDRYLCKGYPIGTGVVEGACRHLVKDRMERAGMSWNHDGAQAILDLRSVRINGDWEAFWDFHVRRERERIYGQRAA